MEGFDFKLDPIWKKKDIVGVDIGTKTIKFVQLKKQGRLTRLIGHGQLPVPENYIIEGIIAEPEKLSELIKQYFNENSWGKVTAKRVAASLPESKIFTHLVTLPQKSQKETEEAVNWEASQTIPMAMTDLYLDWQVIGPSAQEPGMSEVIYTAAPRAIVDSYVQLFDALGLELASIETNLLSIVRAIVSQKKNNVPTLVIDIGGRSTNLAVVDEVIRITGSTLLGGEQLTFRVSQALDITEAKAEKALTVKDEKERVKIRQALDTEVTEITKEATRVINYYEERNTTRKIERILLCGGSASLPTLTDVFTEKLGIKASVGNPWSNISVYPLKSIPKEDVPSYTNAVGLALLGVEDD